MFELLDDLPDNVMGVKAIGELDDDYEDVLVAAIEDRASLWSPMQVGAPYVKAFGWLIPGDEDLRRRRSRSGPDRMTR